MEENIMTTTEELVETAEDIVLAEPDKKIGYGFAAGAAVTVIGALAYKFIAKPIAAKIKAKKAQKAAEAEENLIVVEDDSIESDEE